MTIIADNVDTPLLEYLRALSDRLAAEAEADRLATGIQKVAEGFKNWRQLVTAPSPGVGSPPTSLEELPTAEQLRQALERWKRAHGQETAAWKKLPQEWRANLHRMTQHPPPS
jgi:hypothetical protein